MEFEEYYDDSENDYFPDERASPKKGRRATGTAPQSTNTRDANEEIATSKLFETEGALPPPKPPRKKTDGWADSSVKTAKWRSSSGGLEEEIAQKSDLQDDKDITMIPDLDDFQDEDLAAQIAKAPNVAVNRVATYKELDKDLLRHTAFATLDDIDLKLLMKFLSPEAEIKEDDIPWTWDMLLADVSSKLSITEIQSQEET